jgi:hypothetical protein
LHLGDRTTHAATLVVPEVAVSQFARLVTTGRGSGRGAGAPERAVEKFDVDFYRRPAARIEYLPAAYTPDAFRAPHSLFNALVALALVTAIPKSDVTIAT